MRITLREKLVDAIIGRVEQAAIWIIVQSIAKGTPQPRYYEMAAPEKSRCFELVPR